MHVAAECRLARLGEWTDHAGKSDTTRCDQHRLHRMSAGGLPAGCRWHFSAPVQALLCIRRAVLDRRSYVPFIAC